jgi:hypothetical protein
MLAYMFMILASSFFGLKLYFSELLTFNLSPFYPIRLSKQKSNAFANCSPNSSDINGSLTYYVTFDRSNITIFDNWKFY